MARVGLREVEAPALVGGDHLAAPFDLHERTRDRQALVGLAGRRRPAVEVGALLPGGGRLNDPVEVVAQLREVNRDVARLVVDGTDDRTVARPQHEVRRLGLDAREGLAQTHAPARAVGRQPDAALSVLRHLEGVEVAEGDLHRARHDGTAAEVVGHLRARVHAELARVGDAHGIVRCRRGRRRGSALRRSLPAKGHRPRGVGRTRLGGGLVGLHDEVAAHRLAAVVAGVHLHGRDRILHEVCRHEGDRLLARRVRPGAAFRVVAPAVAVVVGPEVAHEARGEEALGRAVDARRVEIFPVVLAEVVVGEHLAQVEAAHPEEVVRHDRAVGGERARLERRHLREGAVLLGEDLGAEVLGHVGEAVVVAVRATVRAEDAVEGFPPVRQAVAVAVDERLEGVVHRAVGLHARREVADVGFAGRHPLTVVVDERLPREAVRRAVGLLRDLLPPVGDAVAVEVVARVGPGVGGAEAVPHLGAALRERTAERHDVRRAERRADPLELVHFRHRRELAVEIGERHEAVSVVDHVVAAVVVVERVGVHRVREDERLGVHRLLRRADARHALGPVLGIDRRAVQRREVRHHVLHPRHPAVVGVDRVVDRQGLPPAAVEVSGHVLAAHAHVVKHVLREARGLPHHVRRVNRARQGLEVVVEHELDRQRQLPVVVVPRRPVGPGRVDGRAQGLHVLRREAQLVAVEDLLGRLRAVPHADLVDVALVEGVVARPRRRRRERHAGRIARTGAEHHRALRQQGVAGPLHREEVGVGDGLLRHADCAVRRHEGRRLGVDLLAVRVEREAPPVEGGGHVRPGALGDLRTHHRHAATRRARLNGVRTVEEAVEATVGHDADAEVRAQLAHVVRERVRVVVDRTLQHDLVARDVLGIDPRLNRELAEGVEVDLREVARRAGVRDGGGVRARQPQRLAAVRIREVERIGDRRRGHLLLLRVVEAVVVRVVALVLLEGEHEAVGVGSRPRVERDVGNHRTAVRLVVLRGEALLGRGVRHPERRRVRMRRLRARDVRVERLLVVIEAVAVRIAARRADHPREAHRIVDRIRRGRYGPARPGVVPATHPAAVGLCNHVVRERTVRNVAEERVEAVEELVVVVHAVVVRIPLARIGRAVAAGLRAAGNGLRTQHHAVALLVVVDAARRRRVERGLVPRLRRHGKVAERAEVPGARGGIARLLHARVVRLAVHDVHRQEAEELERRRVAGRHPLAHERRGAVVVAEVAERLHEVLLIVLEAVVVEVEVAARARGGVDEARVRPSVARERRIARAVTERTVHAGRDVVVARHCAVGEAVAAADELEDPVAQLQRAVRLPGGREDHAGELAFPRVGQTVAVRIDRAGVEAAAADAGGTVVLGRAVDEGVGVEDVADFRLVAADGLAPDERRLPGAPFLAVEEAVAVGVRIPRVGREELVVPARNDAGVVRDDGRAGGIGVAGIRTRILKGVRELVGVLVEFRVVLGVRVVLDVEFPAVRHAVAVRVGAVDLARERHVTQLGGRHPLRIVEREVGRRRALQEDIGALAVNSIPPPFVGLDRELALVAVHQLRRRLVAVLEEQVLVERRVRDRVDRQAGLALEVDARLRRLPARGDVARVVLVPRRARIEAKLRVHLVVEERDGLVAHHGNRRVRRLPEIPHARVERQRVDLLAHVVDRVLHLAAPEGRDPDARLVRRAVVAEDLDGDEVRQDGFRQRVRAVGALHEGPLAVGREGEDARPRDRDDRVGLLGIPAGHEVAVRVHLAVLALLGADRVHAIHDFPVVAQAVAVRIPVDGVRAHGELFEVRETVVVRVARLERIGGRDGGVERGRNLFGREALAGRDVLEREARTFQALPLALLVDPADRGAIPVEVLVAVREAVPVRVIDGRVGAVLGNPAVGVGLEVVGQRRDVGVPRRAVLRPLRQQVRRRDAGPRVVFGDRQPFGVRERGVRHPCAAHVAVEAVGRHAIVEVFVEAAQFRERRESPARRRPVDDVRDEGGAGRRGRGQEVARVLAARGRDRIGVPVPEALDGARLRLVVQLEAGGLVELLAASPRRLHRVDVGDAVLVQVAHVVRREVFEGEDRLQQRRLVGRGGVVELGQRDHLPAHRQRTEFRQHRAVQVLARVARLAARGVEDPAEEEAVLPVEVHIVVVRSGRRGRARRVDREVLARRQRAVVHVADLVAARVDRGLEVFGGIGPLVDEARNLGRRRRAVRPHAAVAEAHGGGVVLGELRDAAAHAVQAARLAGIDLDELGRRHVEIPFARGGCTVLVLDQEAHGLRTRAREGDVLRHRSHAHVHRLLFGPPVVGPRHLHRLLVDVDVGRVPGNRVGHVDRDGNLVRHGDAGTDFRRLVDDVDLQLTLLVVLVPGLGRIGRLRVRHDARRDLEALPFALRRTVEFGEEDALPRNAVPELQIVGIQDRQRVVAVVRTDALHVEVDDDVARPQSRRRHGEVHVDEPQRAARLGFLEDRAAVVGREGDGRRIQRLDEDREGVLLRRAPLCGRHVLVVHVDGHLVLAGLGERVEDVLRLIGVALQFLR